MIVDNPLIDADWLHKNLNQKNLVVIDCSWYLPSHKRDAETEYKAGHIQGAQFFDLEAVSDKESSLPHMLPKAEEFSKVVSAIGISENSLVILYDGMGVFSSPRVWWMFLVFGLKNVRILNGGLPAWVAKGYSLTTEMQSPEPGYFNAIINTELIAGMKDVQAAITSENQIIDARSAGRFAGKDPEPRIGLESGHMPNALNMPQTDLIKNGYFLAQGELYAVFNKAGVNIDKPTITTCGSGVTAASLTLGLAVLGKPVGKLYDGSWVEWASHKDNKIIKSDI